MSYYRRSYYRTRNYSRHNYSYSNYPSATDPKKPIRELDVKNYLKEKFFNCDEFTFGQIATLYARLYGIPAHNYMMDTFYKWKSGQTWMNGQSSNRVLECVTKFLTEEERFYILKCEVVYFLKIIQYNQQKQKNRNLRISEVNTVFEQYQDEINNFDTKNLSWFMGRGIFTAGELEQFLNVCKYSLTRKLKLSYQQIQNDLQLINEYLREIKAGTYTGTYTIDFIDTTINVLDLKTSYLPPATFQEVEMPIESKFKSFAEKYILDELLKLEFSQREGDTNGLIHSSDLQNVIDNYNKLINSGNEISLNCTFQGEGGNLKVNIKFIPTGQIINDIFKSSIAIFAVIAISIALYYLSKAYSWIGVFSIYAGFYLIYRIFAEIYNIKTAIKKLENNG